ncbi:MAG: PAS domain S-box protein, partial [Promethearchaeota archaeon]
MKRKDGSIFYSNINSSQIEIAGKPYFLGFFSDVTNRLEAEQKLKESEEKFRSIAEYSDAEISIIQDGVFKYINQKALDTVGYTSEEIDLWKPNELFEKIVHQNQRELLRRIAERIQSGDKEHKFHDEMQFRHKSGEDIWLDMYSRSITFQGRPAALNCSLNITDKKKAEEELKESEEKFRSITEQSFMAIIVIQDGIFKYFNERTADINGYSVEEISNWQPYEFSKHIHPDDKDFVMNQVRTKQAGDTGVLNQYQYRIIKKNGDIIWIENFSKPINYQGKPADLAMIIDITEKIQAEQKIKESEKILKDFIHNATDSISIWDSNLNLIEINKVAADPWDSPTLPEKGISMSDLAPLITKTDRYEKYLKVIKTGEPISFDNVEIPPKEGERYFNIKAFRVGNGLGIIGNEITDHIRFEQELKESEEKFRTIAEQSFMGIAILQEGKIKYSNKALANISEYPIEEMLQWSDRLIAEMIHPEDVDYVIKRLQSNKEDTMSELSQHSFRIINKKGEIRWLEDYASKIIYEGKSANLISVIDITDKKQAEQLIVEENQRLLELEELRKDLITRVSHELKTPMTSIYGTIQILLSIFREKLDKDTLKYVNIAYRGCLRLRELIENLLDTSRLESKKFELKLQKEDLTLLIDDCVYDMSNLADIRQQIIEINTPYRIDFEIDRLRFRQVIVNIISNAIKNTPREGLIVISLNEEDEYIDIKVKDNGVGITLKEKERLFEKFGKIERFGLDLDVDIEGSGLGLYISKEIVELHGGQILVESEGRNKGSIFIIRL